MFGTSKNIKYSELDCDFNHKADIIELKYLQFMSNQNNLQSLAIISVQILAVRS